MRQGVYRRRQLGALAFLTALVMAAAVLGSRLG